MVAKKQFEHHELRKVSVRASTEVRDHLAASSREGRQLLQAFSEVFGQYDSISVVTIELVPKRQHFHVGVEEHHPLTGAEPHLLVITAHPTDRGRLPHTWYVNARDVEQVSTAPHQGFRAVLLAEELACQFEERRIREEGDAHGEWI